MITMFAAWSIHAQSLRATVSKSQVGKSEQFRLVFEANGPTKGFQAPDLSDFDVKGGPFPSEQTTIINGRMSVSVSYTFVLQPRDVGTFTIGSAVAEVNGEKVKSNPVRIEVVKDEDRPRDPNDPYSIASDATFIRLSLSKKSVFVGEPVVVSYKLYFQYDIGNYEFEYPELSGFYKTELENDPQRQVEVVDGVRYNTVTVRRYMLIPQKSGELAIDPLVMDAAVNVPTRQRDFFGRPVFRSVNIQIKPPTRVLRVKPLPNPPAQFTGAVGKFDMSFVVSDSVLGADEGVDLALKISGSGNLTLFDLPKPEIPSYFETFDPQYEEKTKANAAGIRGEISQKYLLISRYKGDYKIPPIEWTYFDPEEEVYKTLKTAERRLSVTTGVEVGEGDPSPNTGSPVVSGKEPVQLLNRDILYIKPRSGIWQLDNRNGQNWIFLLGLWVLPSIVFGWLGVRYVERRNAIPVVDRKRKKARRIAMKRLKNARRVIETGSGNFYEELSKGLEEYLEDKLAIPRSEMNWELVENSLVQQNVPQEVIQSAGEVWQRCEYAKYGQREDESDRQKLLDQAESVILKLEERL